MEIDKNIKLVENVKPRLLLGELGNDIQTFNSCCNQAMLGLPEPLNYPRSVFVHMGDKQPIEDNTALLYTVGVANCKGLAMLLWDSDKRALIRHLAHISPNDSIHAYLPPRNLQLLAYAFIPGPRGDLRRNKLGFSDEDYVEIDRFQGSKIELPVKFIQNWGGNCRPIHNAYNIYFPPVVSGKVEVIVEDTGL